MIGTGSKYIKDVDDFLTLEGLRIIWERNVARRAPDPGAKIRIKTAAQARDPRNQDRRRRAATSRSPLLPLTCRGKLFQLLHRNRRAASCAAAEADFCFPRSTGL